MNQNMPKVYACQKLPPSLMNCLPYEVLGLFFDTTYILRNHSTLQEKVGASWNGCSLVDRKVPIFLTKEVLFIPEKVAVDSEMRPFLWHIEPVGFFSKTRSPARKSNRPDEFIGH